MVISDQSKARPMPSVRSDIPTHSPMRFSLIDPCQWDQCSNSTSAPAIEKMSSWQSRRSQLGSNGVFTLPDTDTDTDYYWTHCCLYRCRCLEVWTHHNIGDILAAKMCLLHFSRTLTAVHDNILEDLCFPAEIVGKRTRVKLDGSKLIKIHLDKTQQTTVEHKVHVIIHTQTHTHTHINQRDISVNWSESWVCIHS